MYDLRPTTFLHVIRIKVIYLADQQLDESPLAVVPMVVIPQVRKRDMFAEYIGECVLIGMGIASLNLCLPSPEKPSCTTSVPEKQDTCIQV